MCVYVQKTALDAVTHTLDLFTLLLGYSLELIKPVRLGGHQFPGMQASCPKPRTTQTEDFHFSHPKAVSHVCLVLEATVSHVCLNETRFHVVKSQAIDDLKSVC